MGELTKRATVYLDPLLHRALRLKAVETSKSMSELVNEAVRFSLAEDAADLAAFEERVKEPLVPYETFLKELKQHGRI
ncbi:MAG: CopG family transcriptional regulator [Candidatus Eisenbacteria bacterium]